VYGPELWQILAQQWSVLLVGYLPAVAMATILTGLAEEPGWRGFALPRLQARYSPLVASLILGIVWHLWHLPSMLFQPGGLSMFFLWGVATIVNGFILAWAYNSTGGSILIAALLHATQNTSTRVLSVLLYAMNPELLADQVQYMRETYLIAAASFGVLLLLVIIRTRGTLAYKGGKAAEVVLERE
jgi:membrane protease YdiL (CAAX protease family)